MASTDKADPLVIEALKEMANGINDLVDLTRAEQGLTIREHFAGLAMHGLLAADAAREPRRNDNSTETVNLLSRISMMSVRFADMLIKQLGT